MKKLFSQTELISEIAEKAGLTKVKVKDALEAFAHILIEKAKEDYSVVVPVIGRFVVKESKERIGRNPKTGEKITLPAKKKISFTASAALKSSI